MLYPRLKMTKIGLWGAVLALGLAAACSSPVSEGPRSVTPPETQLRNLKIWPVGDSITDGASACWGIWSPENGGYRRNLMLLLNDGYSYQFLGNNNNNAPGGSLAYLHSGYRGTGLDIFKNAEFTAAAIADNRPDATLLMLGINSLGSKKEYPDTQGSYWSSNGHQFNTFFVKYREFIDRVLANTPATSVVFVAKIPPIGATRFYQRALWDENKAPGYDDGAGTSGWTTVGDGSVAPQDVVGEFNTELQALVEASYAGNPRVVVVDQNTGMTVGTDWQHDVCAVGTPQNWWNGDGLHPTQAGYRHLAERWNTAIRKAFPSPYHLLYSVDCGTVEGAGSSAAEGALVGTAQSTVWDKPYGPDAVTGKSWGHVGEANWQGLSPAPADPSLYLAWTSDTDVTNSVATATTGHDLVYRFEVPAGGTYRVFLGFHDTWGENATPKGTARTAQVFLDGVLKGTRRYKLGDFGKTAYETTTASGLLEVKLTGAGLLDSIGIQRLY